jgi:nucleoside-diphosphate-sugar epimerase
MFMSQIIRTLLSRNEFAMTEGLQKRDFVFVSDLVDAIHRSILLESSGLTILNIASGQSVRLRDVATIIGQQLRAEHLLRIGAIQYRESEVMSYSVDISRARELLQWGPETDLIRGIALTIDAMKEQ